MLACDGAISDGSQFTAAAPPPWATTGGSSQAPQGTPPGIATPEDVRQADDAMRAGNPDLFDTAITYFPGEVPQAGPTRLSRLTRTQLDLTTQHLLPDAFEVSATQALPVDPLQTNYEFASNLSFNQANFTPFTTWVRGISDRVATDPASVIPCTAADRPCLAREAQAFVQRAFRGTASPDQVQRFETLFVDSVDAVGLAQATADLVAVTLSSPSYVFRDEVQTDAAGNMPQAQALQHLTYTLADAPPTRVGLPEAASAYDSSVVDAVMESTLAREKLVKFFVAWLEIKEAESFDNISTEAFPEFTPELAAAMVEETHRFLKHHLEQAAPRLKDITQSEATFVSQTLADIYSSSGWSDVELTALDPAERLGIFTQPAVIASHSGPTTTRLVKRGVFFTRKVMCLALGAPPADVDTTVPDTPGATERERINSVTAEPRCLGCHTYINPFGFMQESFDPLGRFRTEHEGLPIDSSIQIDFLEEGPLRTETSTEALRELTSSARFQQCFVRQLFRFYMGRDEDPGDDPMLRKMFFQFADGDTQDILSLLRTLSTSSTFNSRTEIR